MDGALINAFLDEGRGLGFDPTDLPDYGLPLIHTANAFPSVERSQLGVIMAEVSIGAGGLDDATVRSALGDLMGAGVLLTGNLATPQWSDDFTTHKKTETDKDGNKRTYTQHCATRTTRLTFDVRLINSKTGVIMGSDSIGRVSNVRKCDRRRRNVEANLPDPYSVGSDMIGSLAYETANMIAPYRRGMDFSLERNKTTKAGIKMAKKGGDTIGAALLFREAAQADPYNEWLQYNAAVMLAVNYHLEEAAEFLGKARAINDRPRFRKFADKLDTLLGWRDGVVAMGLGMDPIPLVQRGAAATAPESSSNSVVVKGGKKKRVALTSEPGAGSVVVMVPGKMTLKVLGTEGGYLKVETFDGKVGWIAGSEVK